MRLEIEPSSYSPSEVAVSGDTSFPPTTPDVTSLVKEGVAAAQRGDRPAARMLLTRVTETDPTCTEAWMWLASISEYPEELLVFLNKVLELEPANERALEWRASTRALIAKTFVHRGVVAKDEGREMFAVECFNAALENDPNCEMAWFWKASMDANEASRVAYLEKVLSINPHNSDAKAALESIAAGRREERFRTVQATVVEGNWYQAVKDLDDFLADDLSNVEGWTLRSHISPNVEEKLLCYERILASDPNNAFAIEGRSFLQSMMDAVRTPQAAAAEVSLEIEPEAVAAPEPFASVAEPVAIPEAPTYFADEHTDEPVASSNGHSEEAEAFLESLAAEFTDHHHVTEDDLSDAVEVVDELSASELDEEEPEHVDDHHADQSFLTPIQMPDIEVPQVERSTIHDTVVDDTAGNFVSAFDQRFAADNDPQDDDESEESVFQPEPVEEVPAVAATAECPYCAALISPSSFSCRDCRAVLSLSDIDSLFSQDTADIERIHEAVSEMEASAGSREFTSAEYCELGMGHVNLKNFDKGLAYLHEGVRLDPNNVILAGEVNALAIRLDELRRQSENEDAKPKGRSILVVDDSATVRKLISNKLEKHGHTVICAADGVEAMEAIDSFTPELVLLDITMPRMDGYQVCKMIRAHDSAKDVPVVMISGKDGFFDKVRGRMSGCSGYITKPFGPETLMKALDTYLLQPELAVD